MKASWKDDISFYSHEKIRTVKVTCKCGHVLDFISNKSRYCNHCGRTVYPTKKCEFKEKLIKEINKCR